MLTNFDLCVLGFMFRYVLEEKDDFIPELIKVIHLFNALYI